MAEITSSDRKKIIDGIIQEAKSDKGRPRIGWHVNHVLGRELYSEISQFYPRFKNDKRYIITEYPDKKDFEVIVNSSYYFDLAKEFIIAPIIGAVLALLVGYTLWRVDSRARNQELERLQQRIEDVSNRLNSIEHAKP